MFTFPIYNTIMAVAAGVGLLLVVDFGRRLTRTRVDTVEGWVAAFAALGFVLIVTGAHMTLTWPLQAPVHFDNIVFGEPSLAFGVLLVAGAWLLHRRTLWLDVPAAERAPRLAESLRPLSWFAFAMGLGCFGIAAAGIDFELFAAPPQEPISGRFSDHPLVEAIFISTIYALVGLGGVLLPFALDLGRRTLGLVVGAAWGLAGIALLAFGALNYYTHIGLLVRTSGGG